MAELLAVELLNRLKKDIVDQCWGSIMSSELPRVVGSDEPLNLRKRRFQPCFLMRTRLLSSKTKQSNFEKGEMSAKGCSRAEPLVIEWGRAESKASSGYKG
jgi:hypothetical protein